METRTSRERILTSTPKDSTSPADRHERKTLQTLQLSATGKVLNGGKNYTVQQKESLENKKKAVLHEESQDLKPSHSSILAQIYEDSSISEGIPVTLCSRLTQTDDSLLEDLLQERHQRENDVDDSGRESGYIDAEAYDLMVKEEVSETYWKELAEERRRALKESLAENQNLYARLENLVEENKKLREENAQLSDIAAKAEALRELLESVVPDDDEDTGEEGDCTGLDYTDKDLSLVSESDLVSADVQVSGTNNGTDPCEDKATL
ncbi:hypothetical protein BsWGS_02345 [Bradybaena similaris]